MKRSAIEVALQVTAIPDCASLHPGYGAGLNQYLSPLGKRPHRLPNIDRQLTMLGLMRPAQRYSSAITKHAQLRDGDYMRFLALPKDHDATYSLFILTEPHKANKMPPRANLAVFLLFC